VRKITKKKEEKKKDTKKWLGWVKMSYVMG